MHRLQFAILILQTSCLISLFRPASSFAAPRIELATGHQVFQGRRVAHNHSACWIAAADGTLSFVDLHQVKSFQLLQEEFRPKSSVQLKSQLQRELGKQFSVAIKGDFVVAGPQEIVGDLAELLEQMSRSFSRYVSRRRLPVSQLEFPLVVVVYPDQASFRQYCEADKIEPTQFLKGYYHPTSNRVAMYWDDALTIANQSSVASTGTGQKTKIPASTHSTLIHEGIHQLAFNYGLHSRVGRNPRWVIEGFAMMLESEGNMNPTAHQGTTVNRERLDWFLTYRKQRREESLANFVANEDDFFRKSILDAYSQAWALTYFLAETRPSKYAEYLQLLAVRDPLVSPDSPETRLQDFQSVFGEDLAWLEVQFHRFVDELAAQTSP